MTCPSGYKINRRTGACTKFGCERGFLEIGQACVANKCPSGVYYNTSYKACVGGPIPHKCPANHTLIYNSCVRTACSSTNQVLINTSCLDMTCPSGYHLSGTYCYK